MHFQLTATLLALATAALPALAKEIRVSSAPGACINTGSQCGGGRFALSDDGRPYADSLDKGYWVNVDALGRSVRCYWVGQATSDVVDFRLQNSASYMHPCGPHHGITMICDQPYPTCQ